MPTLLHNSKWVNWFRRTFSLGSNTDVRSELMKDGLYDSAVNMRPAQVDGNTGGLETIRGEEILYPADVLVTNPTSYVSIGRVRTNGHTVEFWASSLFDAGAGANPPYIRVDGVITAMSPYIPYTFNRPMQLAVVENCAPKEGIIFPADAESDLLFWDVKAMLDALASGSQLFFLAYSTDVNSVSLNAPPTIIYPAGPDCIIDLGSSVGLPVGQYSYFARYVDINGNRTNWGPPSGLIPIPAIATPNNVSPAPNYPRTIGGVADILVPSQYGAVIEFRVNNPFGYASIEIGRQRFNEGGGTQAVGEKEIISRIPIVFGQSNIVTLVDPADTNINPPEIIPPNEAVQQFINPKQVKAIDYADLRLKIANYKIEPRDIVLTFLDFGGKKMTAITKALKRLVSNGIYVPDGYDNPYNCAVFKSAQRGGQAKYGIQFWDGGYGLYPAVNIPEPFTAGTDIFPFPQRRDIKGVNGAYGADSTTYSDDPCYAATVDVASQTAEGPVGSTFEAFTGGTQTKTDTSTLINVAKRAGPTPSIDVGRPADQFTLYSSAIPQDMILVSQGGNNTYVPNTTNYQPWDPRNNQAQTSGFNVPPNTSRFTDSAGVGGAFPAQVYPSPAGYLDQCYPFNPANNKGACFNPTHQALGALLAGVDSGIPQGAGIMSIVYNGDTRGEIVAQGFGSWNLQNNPNTSDPSTLTDFDPANKSTTSLRTFFPDQAGGIIDQALWEDIQQNPGNYQVRMVSPVPFYPEIYGYKGFRVTTPGSLWCGDAVMSNLMDIMCHTSFLHDEGQVNVGITPVEGYQPIPGNAPDGSWVGFDKWRRSDLMDGDTPVDPLSNSYSWWQQEAAGNPALFGQGGNALFTIASGGFSQRTTGRTTYYELITDQYIYPPASNTTGFQTNLNGTQVRNFQGPWYVLNIIRVGNTIPDANIEPYKNMGNHIAFKQTIGLYQGGVQDFRLIGEREYLDCTNYLPTDYRYAYATDDTFGERRWLCVTGNTQINVAQILLAILTFGSWINPADNLPVYGLYDSVVNTTGRYIQFGNYPTVPAIGARISIKYDKTAPIRCFGHDVTIAPVTHAVRDSSQTTLDNSNLNSVDILAGLPFIHAGFGSNPRWFVPESDNVTQANIYLNFMGSIRQWCIMWSAESRLLPSMYVNENSTFTALADRRQYFPAIHYVARPMDGVDSSGFFDQYYAQDYPLEPSIFPYGGLRYLPGVNLDYARQPDIGYFGYPKVGITLPDDFCTVISASLPFNPQAVDSPGLRTFLWANSKVLSDEGGEIKVIATATNMGGAGQDQYVWFQNAVGRVLTEKNILTGASGEQVSTYVTSNYWGTELRISRNIGLPDQFWRLWAKGYATAGDGYMDTFFWPNRKGWYRMRGDQIEDISRNKQLSKLLPILKELPAGYTPQMSAFYNTKFQEMWATIAPYTSNNVAKPPVLVVFSPQTNEWLGEYSYRFDGFLNTDTEVVGMRLSETWSLDQGFTISGNTRESYVQVPIVGELGKFKEMVRWRAIGDKPDGMQLFDKDGVLMSDQSAAIQEAFAPGTGFLWAKLYDSYEGQWWRVMTSYDPARRRAQDVRFFVKVIYNTDGDKTLLALENQLKNIR